jgi:hypothetical protein
MREVIVENGFKFNVGYREGQYARQYNPWNNDDEMLDKEIIRIRDVLTEAGLSQVLYAIREGGGGLNILSHRILPCDEVGRINGETEELINYNRILKLDHKYLDKGE